MEQLCSKLPLCGCTGESKTWRLNRLYGARDASQRISENNMCCFFFPLCFFLRAFSWDSFVCVSWELTACYLLFLEADAVLALASSSPQFQDCHLLYYSKKCSAESFHLFLFCSEAMLAVRNLDLHPSWFSFRVCKYSICIYFSIILKYFWKCFWEVHSSLSFLWVKYSLLLL